MRKVLAMVFMSLDGVAEFPIYDSETGANRDESDQPMWTPQMPTIDTLILGRIAYEKWYSFWPARRLDPECTQWEAKFSLFCDQAEKLVVSKTLRKADWTNSRIVSGEIGEEIARLKSLPGRDIALGGGPRILQSFLRLGLLDELLIEMFPSLLGRGKPLFHVAYDPESPGDFVPAGSPGRRDFKLIEATPREDGTVFLHYQRFPARGT
ncbi:MAG: dihydrofolate reductase family protein [Thermoplasmata archaeon]|nr:dihydrofolate reductase family protein [Thermoplasmata archaeon]